MTAQRIHDAPEGPAARAAQNAPGDGLRALSRHLFGAGAAHPFLREPLERMALVPDPSVPGVATDGLRLFFGPRATPEAADVRHLLAHCLFRHLPPPERAILPLWDLACDISAEYLRAELFPEGDARLTRMRVADALPEDVDPRLAGAVYKSLLDRFEDELDALRARFARDDHRYWSAPPDPSALPPDPAPRYSGGDRAYRAWLEAALADQWPSGDALPGGVGGTGRYGLAPGSRTEKLLLREAAKYDFSRYLRRFSVTREELRPDLTGFDVIPYTYGLARYGNLPLIEPPETAESHRVETLVIAIDTSLSCKRPTVERFFAEIERVLMRHEYFFERMNVRVMQCDAFVQSDVAIRSREDWRRYAGSLVIKGRSGTDFRPVFRRVEQLRAAGELKGLKGLLYFTDGDGAYPQRRPPYETAFVFSTRRALERKLPEWIIPLCLARTDSEEQ